MTDPLIPPALHIRPRWDGTITFGNVLVLIGILASAVGMYAAAEVRAGKMELRIEWVEGLTAETKATNELLRQQLAKLEIDVAIMKGKATAP